MTQNDVALRRQGISDRSYFAWTTGAVALVVLAGFARTYYLKPLFGTPALPWWVHLHGLVMTAWFVLLIVQARLIAARRVDLHRRLGVFGAALAGALVVLLTAVSIHSVSLGHTPGPPLPVLLGFNFAPILLFTVFVGSALLLRRRSDYHKRLMVLASLSLLPAAIFRLPFAFIQAGGTLSLFATVDACVLACVILDVARSRRLHPTFAWGAPLIAGVFPLFLVLAQTPQWARVATWLTS